MIAWIVFLLVIVPLLGFLIWALLDESIVRIPPGKLGLLLVHGKATDTVLDPGVHFVPALRRRMVQEYPSLELSYRAGDEDAMVGSDLEHPGPSLRASLGDRSIARVSYTVRFRLDPAALRTVHNRFGPDGIWAAVRDETDRTIRTELGDPKLSVEDLFGSARETLATTLADAVGAALTDDGMVLTSFSLRDIDLGHTGEVIQATARAGYELAREEAENATRTARARNDAVLSSYLTGDARDAALRYREVDVWRELVQILADRSLAVPGPGRGGMAAMSALTDQTAIATVESEQPPEER